jgi:hypothetical protein
MIFTRVRARMSWRARAGALGGPCTDDGRGRCRSLQLWRIAVRRRSTGPNPGPGSSARHKGGGGLAAHSPAMPLASELILLATARCRGQSRVFGRWARRDLAGAEKGIPVDSWRGQDLLVRDVCGFNILPVLVSSGRAQRAHGLILDSDWVIAYTGSIARLYTLGGAPPRRHFLGMSFDPG